MSLQGTANANRLQIGFFGRCNSGKSTLINAFTAQDVTIVSPVAGTTTDVVQKNIELKGLGPCTLLDTAGFDDTSSDLGALRLEKTEHCSDKVDIAVVVFDSENLEAEAAWVASFKEKNTPIVAVISKCDLRKPSEAWLTEIGTLVGSAPLCVDITNKEDMTALRFKLVEVNPLVDEPEITGKLVHAGDTVMLVMPQDIQAPKGRLILPQVQTIRELLDKHAVVMAVTTDEYIAALDALKEPPKLIITDSQVFAYVHEHKPAQSLLTSFSVLFAGLKGDLNAYIQGAKAIEALTPSSKVLIAELCSHAPLEEDIGRVKIPRMLRKRYGETIEVEIAAGSDFPDDLTKYDLIIQCGACMVNRKLVQSRITKAKKSQVPITNYGITIAYLNGILEEIVY